MAILNHENVVKFFGFEKVDGTNKKAIIMDNCEGNLQDAIDNKPNGLAISEVMRLDQNIVGAMARLRSKNVIHRDIKPGNILLFRQEDGQSIYKLTDFGAARFLKPDETYGSLYGTFEYLHPDIFGKYYAHNLNILPEQRFTDGHELWSIGVTIYEAITGELPFEPKKGRQDPQNMYTMISQKNIDDI
ncbi:serine/threonine-protein kinase TBK1-like [Sitodiplosis mosellana]|uniref:serine/threonine-protein kinase TBK1-like n=1 Tax=Sitodiplosis mosellana TaxID=263140 RepID=UPI0024447F6A|nr:serine/threonine-protein kinase TBK1-like [Sitodiplosis mosellana]